METTLQQSKTMRRTLVLHPFFLAAFPPIFLLADNVRQFQLTVVVLPILTLLLAATCSLGDEPKTLLELAATVRSRLEGG